MQSNWPPASKPVPPELIAQRYQLSYSLGKGGFGEVFYALDLKFSPPRPVALKKLHSQLLLDPQIYESIKQEANSLARFSHPNILQIFDFEVTPTLAYIVTELAEGGSLATKLLPDPNLPPKPMAVSQVGEYLKQIAGALDEAHDKGVIHRDIKPANLLLDKDNRLLLADFGQAVLMNNSTTSMLMQVDAWGTPEYAAPERWEDKAGKASDIYAVGVVLFQLLSGQQPYQGSIPALIKQHLNDPIPKLSDRHPGLNYPAELDVVIAQAMAKEVTARPKKASQLYELFMRAIASNMGNLTTTPAPAAPITDPKAAKLLELVTQFDRAEAQKNTPVAISLAEQILFLDSNYQPVRSRLGGLLHQQALDLYFQGDYDAPVPLLNRAIRLDPKQSHYFYLLGSCYFKKEFFDRAITNLTSAIQIDTKKREYYNLRGRCFIEKKEYEQALADFNKMMPLGTPEAMDYYWRGCCYYQKQYYERATIDFSQALELGARTNNAEIYYWRGRCYFHLANDSAAMEDLDQAIRLNSAQAGYFYWRAKTHFESRRYLPAINDLERVLKFHPNNTYAYYWRGRSRLLEGEYIAAITDFNSALEANTDWQSNSFTFASSMYVTDTGNQNKLDYIEPILSRPKKSDFYHWRAKSYVAAKQYDTALVDIETAIDKEPGEAEYYLARAECCILRGDGFRAESDITRTIELAPDKTARIYICIGQAYYHRAKENRSKTLTGNTKKLYQEAIRYFDKVLGIDAHDLDAHFWLGRCYFNLMEYNRALDELDEVNSGRPGDAATQYWRGRCYYEKTDYDRALTNFLNASEAVTTNGEYFYWCGMTYIKKREKTAALHQFDRALQLGYTKAKEAMDNIRWM